MSKIKTETLYDRHTLRTGALEENFLQCDFVVTDKHDISTLPKGTVYKTINGSMGVVMFWEVADWHKHEYCPERFWISDEDGDFVFELTEEQIPGWLMSLIERATQINHESWVRNEEIKHRDGAGW